MHRLSAPVGTAAGGRGLPMCRVIAAVGLERANTSFRLFSLNGLCDSYGDEVRVPARPSLLRASFATTAAASAMAFLC